MWARQTSVTAIYTDFSVEGFGSTFYLINTTRTIVTLWASQTRSAANILPIVNEIIKNMIIFRILSRFTL